MEPKIDKNTPKDKSPGHGRYLGGSVGSSCTGWAIFQPMGPPTHPFYLDYYVFFGDFGCPTPDIPGIFIVFRPKMEFSDNRTSSPKTDSRRPYCADETDAPAGVPTLLCRPKVQFSCLNPFFCGGRGDPTRRASRGVPPLPSIAPRKKYRRSGVNPHCDHLLRRRYSKGFQSHQF